MKIELHDILGIQLKRGQTFSISFTLVKNIYLLSEQTLVFIARASVYMLDQHPNPVG